MQAFKERAEKLTKNIENKAIRIVAFYTALAGFIALIPTVFAGIYYIVTIGVHLWKIDSYVTKIGEAQKYNYFMIGQLSRMIEAESDYKTSFGIPVRMTNPPNGASSGDLWYPTYIKVNGEWHPIIYGAFPYITKKQVGILDINGEYTIAGKEPHPDKEELERLHNHK
jgi:hypothetical protein